MRCRAGETSVTVRHNSRLHHIGLGARMAGTPISLLIDDLHIRVIHRHTGQLIRELILDPTRDYQPRGLPPDHPNAPPAASRSGPRCRPQPESRLAEGHPKGPGLDPARTAPPSLTGMPKHPNCNDVPRHLLTGPETSQ